MVDLAFVTGASGFVGSAVARALLAAGYRVRALVRRTSPRSNLDVEGLQVAEGDMLDERAVARAVAEARYVFHVAADYRLWAPDPGEIVHNNVEGTRIVLRAAQAAGVERIVYTSSVATLRLNPDGVPADESEMLSQDRAIGAYKRSKVAAESLALQMASREGLPLVIVNPSTPIGPRDVRPTPTGRIIVEAASGRMPAFVDTGLNLVHVDDVAGGHLLALQRGRIGQRYILGGENVTLARMLEMIAGLVGRRAPRVRLPRRAIYPIAFASEAIARFTGREPFATLDGLRMAKYRMFFTSAKAQSELGYTARPVIEALKDAIAWFRQAGLIR
ncbi:MAG: NAD-dependent epimerase/dehydratase family protein [Betaproteobacteria bacterium]|nr:MAG: NAD-dependent epimerase/dehydratase family protein [Betaproteobacteria bacterium]